MRNKKFFGIVLLIAGLVIVSGCNNISGDDVLRDSIEKSRNFNSYIMEGSVIVTISQEKILTFMDQNFTMFKKGKNFKTVMNIKMLGTNITSIVLNLGNNTYLCYMGYCYEQLSPDFTVPDPQEQLSDLESNLERGLITATYLGDQKFAGRTCMMVNIDFDLDKLPEAELSTLEQGQLPVDIIKSMDMRMRHCFDVETGIPLYMNTTIKYINETAPEEAGDISFVIEASRFDVREPDDSEFELPYELYNESKYAEITGNMSIS